MHDDEPQFGELERRIAKMVAAAVREAAPMVLLTEDEQRALRIFIQRQEQSLKLRQAIIEKSLTALMWAAIVGLGIIVREYMISHGMWRP